MTPHPPPAAYAPNRDALALLALLGSGVLFGLTFVLTKYAKSPDAGGLSAEQVTLLRFLVAASSVPLAHNLSRSALIGKRPLGLLARGLLGFGSVYLSSRAIVNHHEDFQVGIAALLNSTYVVFAPIFAWAFFSEKLSARSASAIILTMLGLGTLEWTRIRGVNLPDIPRGEVWALGSGVLAGGAVATVQKLRAEPAPERPETIVFYYALVSVSASLLLCVLTRGWHPPTLHGWCIVVCLGLATYAAQWLMAYGLRLKDTVLGTLMLTLQNVTVAALGMLLFNEPYSLNMIVGAAFVMLAGVCLSFQPSR